MQIRKLLGPLLLLWAAATPAETLLKSTTSWDGGAIAYPEGQAEITSVMLTLKDGEWAPFHCHPVPTMGYLLNGTAKVQLLDGQETLIQAGEPLVEVMRTVHRGMGVGGDAEIVVFYAGAEGVPVTAMHGGEGADEHCGS